MTGKVIIGTRELINPVKTGICPELEPVGYIITESTVEKEVIFGMKLLIEMIFKSSARYLMASDLHISTIQADYDLLQEKHAKLIESESNYKDISENLEQRVNEQVKTIEMAQLKLYESEKLASVGLLAAGVAHEINNPLAFIRSNLDTSQTYINDLSEVLSKFKSLTDNDVINQLWKDIDVDYIVVDFNDLINESISGVERVKKIIEDLKQFSSVDHSHVEIVDLNEQITSACNIASLTESKDKSIKLNLNPIPQLKCQAGQISQAILNLIVNAQRATSIKGNVTVVSQLVDENIVIIIEDTGCGISQANLRRIYDPFFTTNDIGKGTGLGLTVSRDIILQHHGTIDIESTEGVGTVVTINLPVKQDRA